MKDILMILLRSVFSVSVLFLITKLMGYRQISQLTFYDYIIGISIGSISADMATDLQTDIWKTLVPMVLFGAFSLLLSFLTTKSIHARRFFNGSPVVLMEKGELIRENLKKVHYDINEFLAECRNAGYFNLGDIQYAVMEHNGKISFLVDPLKRPTTPSDLHLNPQKEGLVANLIIDGKVMEKHLAAMGKEEKWLQKQLSSQHITLPEVLLATYDDNDTFTVFPRKSKKQPTDLFE